MRCRRSCEVATHIVRHSADPEPELGLAGLQCLQKLRLANVIHNHNCLSRRHTAPGACTNQREHTDDRPWPIIIRPMVSKSCSSKHPSQSASNPGAGLPYAWPAVIVQASTVLPLPRQCIAMEGKFCCSRGRSEGRAGMSHWSRGGIVRACRNVNLITPCFHSQSS